MEKQVIVNGSKYPVFLEPDLEEGGFIIKCPSVSEGCISQGETEEEALEMIRDAIEGILEIKGKRLERGATSKSQMG